MVGGDEASRNDTSNVAHVEAAVTLRCLPMAIGSDDDDDQPIRPYLQRQACSSGPSQRRSWVYQILGFVVTQVTPHFNLDLLQRLLFVTDQE